MVKVGELAVVSKAKDLCSYVVLVTDKSPKKYRFTFVTRMQNYSLDIIEKIIMANEVYVEKSDSMVKMYQERHNIQRNAMTKLKLLSYVSQVAMEQKCILPKQYENITKLIYDTQNLLGAWIKSDEKDIKIVNIMSSAALRGNKQESVYCATKWGERGYTESLKVAYKGTSVIIDVCQGFVIYTMPVSSLNPLILYA